MLNRGVALKDEGQALPWGQFRRDVFLMPEHFVSRSDDTIALLDDPTRHPTGCYVAGISQTITGDSSLHGSRWACGIVGAARLRH